MNRPRVATVLTAREWEARLVDAARRDPTVLIVRRAYEPRDLDRSAPLDAVVVGSETAWITSARIRSMRNSGTRVIGIYPTGDRPGRDLLRRGGADATFPDSTAPEDVLDAAALVAADNLVASNRGHLITVTGPRGAPGRTEVAISLACLLAERAETALIDLDVDAPGVTFRLGLEPGPDLLDLTMQTPGHVLRTVRGPHDLTVIGGPVPLPPGARARLGIADLLDTVHASFDLTVADTGPWQPDQTILATSDASVLVCDAQPMSLIRSGRLVHDWLGPVPYVVINRSHPSRRDDTVRAARRALGLEPHTLVPAVTAAERSPLPDLSEFLGPLADDLSQHL